MVILTLHVNNLGDDRCGQTARVDHMEDVCRKYYGNSPPPVERAYSRILVDKKNKVLYCVIPKTGCSTWKTLFVNLSGNAWRVKPGKVIRVHGSNINRYGLKYLNQYSTEERAEIFNDKSYLRFIVVRNPFDRLVSAFTDKIKGGIFSVPYMKKYLKTSNEKRRVNFTEFTTYLSQQYKPAKVDIHWQKYEDLCQPCSVHYDFILKLETVDVDLPQFLDKIKANRSLIENLTVRNTKRNKTFTGRILEDFADVPKSVASKLYNVYKADFEYFGYSFDFDYHQSVCQSESNGGCC